MDKRHKQKRNEDAQQRPNSIPAAAEAVVLGTIASGLVIGAAQAKVVQPMADDETGPLPSLDLSPASSGQAERAIPEHDSGTGSIAQPVSAERTVVEAPQETIVPVGPDFVAQPAETMVVVESDALPLAEAATVVDSQAPLAQEPIATLPAVQAEEPLIVRLAEQITANVNQALEAANAGSPVADLGAGIAQGIVQAAHQLIADLGTMPAQLSQTIAELPDALDVTLPELPAAGELVESVLADVSAGLASLPSELLGNEGSDLAGGLLSEIFYSDGNPEPVATAIAVVPDLGLAAASFVDGLGPEIGFLGMSYIDMAGDALGGHGLNALSLL
jgi:hypothetical protein